MEHAQHVMDLEKSTPLTRKKLYRIKRSIAKGALFPLGKKKNYIFKIIEELADSYGESLEQPFSKHSSEFVHVMFGSENTLKNATIKFEVFFTTYNS